MYPEGHSPKLFHGPINSMSGNRPSSFPFQWQQ